MHLKLPNPGRFWTELFPPVLCPAVAALAAGRHAIQGSEDLSLLHSFFFFNMDKMPEVKH